MVTIRATSAGVPAGAIAIRVAGPHRSRSRSCPHRARAGRRGSPAGPACGRRRAHRRVAARRSRGRAAGRARHTRACAPSGAVTLSPSSAQTGMAVDALDRRPPRRSGIIVAIASNRAWSKPTRSILFTASTKLLMPSRRAIVAVPPGLGQHALGSRRRGRWRGRRRDAPVAMLRVYCSWPGRVGEDEAALARSRNRDRRRRW